MSFLFGIAREEEQQHFFRPLLEERAMGKKMSFRIGIVTDLHFGPRALFKGRLRKMSDRAPELTKAFIQRMNDEIHPDLVLTLGDIIEDDSPRSDRLNYAHALQMFSALNAPIRHVVGNHDTINQSDDRIREVWGHRGELFYSFDHGGFHFSVLRTKERPHLDARIDGEQIAWLREDLFKTRYPTIVAMHHGAAEQDLRGNPWFEHAPQVALVQERAELRKVIAESGKVVLVVNGHLHWNHIGIHDGIAYVTVQSLTENLDEDAPGRAASAWAVVEVSESRVIVRVEGMDPCVFEQHFGKG